MKGRGMGLKAVFLEYLVTYNALHPHPLTLAPFAHSAEDVLLILSLLTPSYLLAFYLTALIS